MLVIFLSDAHQTITTFGDVGVSLLKIMGYSEKAMGTIKAEDIPAAITRLQNAIDTAAPIPQNNKDDDEQEPAVSLAHRAFPLIEMLNASAKENCDVMWKIT